MKDKMTPGVLGNEWIPYRYSAYIEQLVISTPPYRSDLNINLSVQPQVKYLSIRSIIIAVRFWDAGNAEVGLKHTGNHRILFTGVGDEFTDNVLYPFGGNPAVQSTVGLQDGENYFQKPIVIKIDDPSGSINLGFRWNIIPFWGTDGAANLKLFPPADANYSFSIEMTGEYSTY